ncbi:hypothetical protein MFIFM68171_03575 [Madurella fahalii]|uniref:SWIM-type domain-containing protein n=1 Tax=Madurella fahalii TaxID=1157608 RepID=A0ABQ0G713_9PEZI
MSTDPNQPPRPSLPTPRTLLTSLINAISNIPLTESDPDQPRKSLLLRDKSLAHANPLRQVPLSHRHLIITLHVLFPEMILPALDLLERGRVGRVVLTTPPAAATAAAGVGGIAAAKADKGRDRGESEGGGGNSSTSSTSTSTSSFYLVASSAAAQPESSSSGGKRRRDAGLGDEDRGEKGARGMGAKGAGKRYLVRLAAWNCSCAAFAFAAVQGDGGMSQEEVEREDGGVGDDVGADWSFGGMSLDGLRQAGEGVPLCKHLLACLLAERWSAALGRYVVEWSVGREEMAGIVADV